MGYDKVMVTVDGGEEDPTGGYGRKDGGKGKRSRLVCPILLLVALVFAAAIFGGVAVIGSMENCYGVLDQCRSNFTHVDDGFLADMHVEIRQKFLRNAAFPSAGAAGAREAEPMTGDSAWHVLRFPESGLAEVNLSLVGHRAQLRRQVQITGGGLYLEGGRTELRYYSDTEVPFQQESNFLYLSGVTDPDCLFFIDVATGSNVLFVPRRDDDYAIWVGYVPTLEEIQAKYKVDSVRYVDEFQEVVGAFAAAGGGDYPIYTLPGMQHEERLASYSVDVRPLGPILFEERSIKTDREVDLTRIAVSASVDAHVSVMKFIRPGMYEYSISSHFLDFLGQCGFTQLAYPSIVGSGYNSAILHYTANTAELYPLDFLLIDAGGQYEGYTSDITRTFPVGGSFTPEHAELYNMVLAIQLRCLTQLRPGLDFDVLMEDTKKYICEELIVNNFVYGTVESCYSEKVWSLYYQHGLGHFIGLDVHDTTSYPLTPLKENMLLTIEPGIYFNKVLLDPALAGETPQSLYLNVEKNQHFLDLNIGGVRIEDDFLITSDGYEELSVGVPKTIEDIEFLMYYGVVPE